MKIKKFSKMKSGELFKFPGQKTVYVFGGGGPKRGFRYWAFEDINNEKTTKTDRKAITGFTF